MGGGGGRQGGTDPPPPPRPIKVANVIIQANFGQNSGKIRAIILQDLGVGLSGSSVYLSDFVYPYPAMSESTNKTFQARAGKTRVHAERDFRVGMDSDMKS